VRRHLPLGSPLPPSTLSWPMTMPIENTCIENLDGTVRQPAREVACGHCGRAVAAGAGCHDLVPLSTGGTLLAVVHGRCRNDYGSAT
jgi:hypothetical protein